MFACVWVRGCLPVSAYSLISSICGVFLFKQDANIFDLFFFFSVKTLIFIYLFIWHLLPNGKEVSWPHYSLSRSHCGVISPGLCQGRLSMLNLNICSRTKVTLVKWPFVSLVHFQMIRVVESWGRHFNSTSSRKLVSFLAQYSSTIYLAANESVTDAFFPDINTLIFKPQGSQSNRPMLSSGK